jgi:hypothetical protein
VNCTGVSGSTVSLSIQTWVSLPGVTSLTTSFQATGGNNSASISTGTSTNAVALNAFFGAASQIMINVVAEMDSN